MKNKIFSIFICVFFLCTCVNVSASNVYNLNDISEKSGYILVNLRDPQNGNFGLCSVDSDSQNPVDPNTPPPKAPLPRFLDAVNGAMNWLKVLIPVILIVLCAFEFVKAVIAGDEKGINNAARNSLKRIIIAIAVFIIPSLIQLIFTSVTNVNGFAIGNDCCCKYDNIEGFKCVPMTSGACSFE